MIVMCSMSLFLSQNEVGSRATGGLGKQGTVVMEDEGLEGDDIDVLQVY